VLSELLATVRHLCARAGVDADAVWDHSRRPAKNGDPDPPEVSCDLARLPSNYPSLRGFSADEHPHTSSVGTETSVRCQEDVLFDDEWYDGAASDRPVAYFVRGDIVNQFLDSQDHGHGAWHALLRLSETDTRAALATVVLWRFRCVPDDALAAFRDAYSAGRTGGSKDESD
jgi:hypothetical protein